MPVSRGCVQNSLALGHELFPQKVESPCIGHSSHQLTGIIASVLVFAIAAGACTKRPGGNEKRIEPVYDKTTGRLQLLKYDSDGDGKIDTVSYMDGARVLRIEIDKDEDGKIDRWEYYGAGSKLEKVGFSRANDGKEDAWSYAGPDGAIAASRCPRAATAR